MVGRDCLVISLQLRERCRLAHRSLPPNRASLACGLFEKRGCLLRVVDPRRRIEIHRPHDQWQPLAERVILVIGLEFFVQLEGFRHQLLLCIGARNRRDLLGIGEQQIEKNPLLVVWIDGELLREAQHHARLVVLAFARVKLAELDLCSHGLPWPLAQCRKLRRLARKKALQALLHGHIRRLPRLLVARPNCRQPILLRLDHPLFRGHFAICRHRAVDELRALVGCRVCGSDGKQITELHLRVVHQGDIHALGDDVPQQALRLVEQLPRVLGDLSLRVLRSLVGLVEIGQREQVLTVENRLARREFRQIFAQRHDGGVELSKLEGSDGALIIHRLALLGLRIVFDILVKQLQRLGERILALVRVWRQ